MSQFEVAPYAIWQTCYRTANSAVELIVTGEVGPRVIRFGFIGQANEFKEYPERMQQISAEKWINFGGHRLWHAPEVHPRTYHPDHLPVSFQQHADFGRFIQPVESSTGIQKELDISLDANSNHVRVVHRLRNQGLWEVELSPWALSVMEAGGTAIMPLPPRGEHPRDLQPINTLAIWSYTDISDPRWTWGRKYILLRQDASHKDPEKIGSLVPNGWSAYVRDSHLFVVTFDHVPGATYPDLNCSVELFTNTTMLEVETLGPITRIPPGGFVEHIENWYLFDNIPSPQNDADVDAHIFPLVEPLISR